MKPLIRTRPPRPDDLPHLYALFEEDGMPLPRNEDFLGGIVAANEGDEPVGFIRILVCDGEEDADTNGNYVYPVIVFKSWQGYGVGRTLIEAAHKKHGALKLVACRASRDFYPKCGFKALSWSEVAYVVAHDCECCPDLEDCDPQPFELL